MKWFLVEFLERSESPTCARVGRLKTHSVVSAHQLINNRYYPMNRNQFERNFGVSVQDSALVSWGNSTHSDRRNTWICREWRWGLQGRGSSLKFLRNQDAYLTRRRLFQRTLRAKVSVRKMFSSKKSLCSAYPTRRGFLFQFRKTGELWRGVHGSFNHDMHTSTELPLL